MAANSRAPDLLDLPIEQWHRPTPPEALPQGHNLEGHFFGHYAGNGNLIQGMIPADGMENSLSPWDTMAPPTLTQQQEGNGHGTALYSRRSDGSGENCRCFLCFLGTNLCLSLLSLLPYSIPIPGHEQLITMLSPCTSPRPPTASYAE
jgi:hypothetical protein